MRISRDFEHALLQHNISSRSRLLTQDQSYSDEQKSNQGKVAYGLVRQVEYQASPGNYGVQRERNYTYKLHGSTSSGIDLTQEVSAILEDSDLTVTNPRASKQTSFKDRTEQQSAQPRKLTMIR